MEKINKLNKKTEYKDILNYAKKVLSVGVAVTPVIGICAGCSTENKEYEYKTQPISEANKTAIVIENGHATIIDFTTNDPYCYNRNTIDLELTNGGHFMYKMCELSSIIFIEDEKSHELAIAYAQSIVGDNYTEYNTEIVERVRTQG